MQGLVMLITGATSGIGRATALHCAGLGARVVAAARSEQRGQALIAEIEAAGGEAIFVAADVRSDDDVKAMVDAALTTYDGLDCAFNNAGTFGPEPLWHEYQDAHWDEVISINLTGVYRCMKYELAAMREGASADGRPRSIVNNASTVGHRGSGQSGPAYTAAKHGVIGLTRQAAIAYVNDNIRINAVSPGPTLTEATASLLEQPAEAVAALLAGLNPTGQLVPVEEIARTVAFLCSDAASMINGHSLPIDGGQLALL